MLVIGGLVKYCYSCFSPDETAFYIFLGSLGICLLFCLIWLRYRCVSAYYANGFLYRSFFRNYTILFEDIESYSLIPIKIRSSYRDRMRGKPNTYQYRIIFFLKEDFPLKKVTILFPLNDDRFKLFFWELRNAVFRRMVANYQKDKRFDWMPHVHILDEGVELSGDAKDASGRDVFISFCDLDTCQIHVVPTLRERYTRYTSGKVILLVLDSWLFIAGTPHDRSEEHMVLHLFRAGGSEPEIMIPCRSPNFYPGYDAFRKIVWEKYGKFLGNSFH